MKLSKRQFLKLGMGSTAGLLFGSFLKPGSLFAAVDGLPASYLNSAVHQHWMNLSYNNGFESRATRRRLGAALANLGARRGNGLGYGFAVVFNQAIESAYQRYRATGRKPGTLLGLIQMLYTDFLYPQTGEAGGRILFATLLAILRGFDGTSRGATAHQSYLAYRQATLDYKNACRIKNNPALIDEARQRRRLCLQTWRTQLATLADLYARRMLTLPANYRVHLEMFRGLDLNLAPIRLTQPRARLTITRSGAQVVVSWAGPGRLQQAPTVLGPWSFSNQSSPARFDISLGRQFFRTVE